LQIKPFKSLLPNLWNF